MRSSAIFALLDKSRLIRREHLEAAIALWEYCDQSVRWILALQPATGTQIRSWKYSSAREYWHDKDRDQ
jgi:hypothetical protein